MTPPRSPSGETTPIAPVNPVRSREGVRPPHGRRLPLPRPARGVVRPLQPRVAAPPDDVRHAQDHADGRRHRPRARRTALVLGTLDGPARLGLGAGLRRRDAARGPRRRGAGTSSWPRARRSSVEDFVAAAFACVGIEDWRHLRVHRPAVRAHRRVERRRSGTPPARATVLGWRPTVPFEEIVRRMVEADMHEDLRE